MKTTIIVAEDHELFRKSVSSLLQNEPDFDVIAECENGRELLDLTKRLAPAVIVLDIAMPEMNGVDTARRLSEACPATRIIVLSGHKEQVYVRAALSAGVVGYIIKSGTARDLIEAIRTASRGKQYLSEEVSDIARHTRQAGVAAKENAPNELHIYSGIERRQYTDAATDCSLSSREREVLQLIAEGRASKEIASSLGITDETVKSHRKNISAKLNIRHIAGLTRYAIRVGLTRP